MMDHLSRSEMFRRMVKESTDPQFVREQFGQPHQYSKTFTILMLFLGTAAFYGALFACASI